MASIILARVNVTHPIKSSLLILKFSEFSSNSRLLETLPVRPILHDRGFIFLNLSHYSFFTNTTKSVNIQIDITFKKKIIGIILFHLLALIISQ